MRRSRWGCHGALGGSASTHLQDRKRVLDRDSGTMSTGSLKIKQFIGKLPDYRAGLYLSLESHMIERHMMFYPG